MSVRARFLVVLALVLAIWAIVLFPVVTSEVVLLIALATIFGALFALSARKGYRQTTIACAVGLAIVSWVLFFAPAGTFATSTLNVDALERVHVGMTLGEVEDLFGGPSGLYGRFAGAAFQTSEGVVGPYGSELRLWTDDSHSLEIAFVDDRVVAKHQRAVFGIAHTVANRIRRILQFRAVGPPHMMDFNGFPHGDPRHPPPPPAPAATPSSKVIAIPRGRPVEATNLSACRRPKYRNPDGQASMVCWHTHEADDDQAPG